ncbi:MAG: hypothetical protein AAGG02_15080 [Cyanobacteria bacterium P01_H01_bin.15]
MGLGKALKSVEQGVVIILSSVCDALGVAMPKIANESGLRVHRAEAISTVKLNKQLNYIECINNVIRV